jgi:hypothetical protein
LPRSAVVANEFVVGKANMDPKNVVPEFKLVFGCPACPHGCPACLTCHVVPFPLLLMSLCRLIIMSFDWVGPDLVFGGMTTLFIITGILSLREAAAGQCSLLSAHCLRLRVIAGHAGGPAQFLLSCICLCLLALLTNSSCAAR